MQSNSEGPQPAGGPELREQAREHGKATARGEAGRRAAGGAALCCAVLCCAALRCAPALTSGSSAHSSVSWPMRAAWMASAVPQAPPPITPTRVRSLLSPCSAAMLLLAACSLLAALGGPAGVPAVQLVGGWAGRRAGCPPAAGGPARGPKLAEHPRPPKYPHTPAPANPCAAPCPAIAAARRTELGQERAGQAGWTEELRQHAVARGWPQPRLRRTSTPGSSF